MTKRREIVEVLLIGFIATLAMFPTAVWLATGMLPEWLLHEGGAYEHGSALASLAASLVFFLASQRSRDGLDSRDVLERLWLLTMSVGAFVLAGEEVKRPGRPQFLAEIRSARAEGIRLSISAETPAYADYVERLVGLPVTYLPYPLANGYEPISWQGRKVIASPGQGRGDKGFFRLYSIFQNLNSIGSNGPFAFDVQDMRKSDRNFRPRYSSLLSHVPDMKFRPARLSQEEIDAAYVGADILVLPYDPPTYALRGSAVFQEGLALGRPVVCSVGLGLSDLVLRYGGGYLATSDRSFAERIDHLAGQPKDRIIEMMLNARQAYSRDFVAGLRSEFGELDI